MKSIKELILEYSTPDSVDDNIAYIDKDGNEVKQYIELSFRSTSARAFIYNKQSKQVVMAENDEQWHYVLVNDNIDDCYKKTGLNKDNYYRRIEKTEKQTDFWKEHPELKSNRFGRLWDLRDEGQNTIVIGWWESIPEKSWYSFTEKVIDYYSKNRTGKEVDKDNTLIVGIDNNCKLFIVDFKEHTAKIAKRSKDSQKKVGLAQAIHNASQRTKAEFYAAFKAYRDEKNQKVYNHTKSRTEAEWRSMRYQENFKPINSIKDFISEQID